MKVLMFGGTGYVGGHVAARLVQDGHAVTSLIRSASSAGSQAKFGVQVVVGELTDQALLAKLLGEHDAAVFAAQLMHAQEHEFVSFVLETLKGTDKKFIFTSGTSLLSIRTDGDWDERSFAEDDVFTPRKQIAPRFEVENRVRASPGIGVRGMIVRPPLIWGNGGARYIADMYHSAQKTGAVCYVGRGLNLYSNVHVEDLADIYAKALEKGVGGALYHAVCGETNNRTLAEAIAKKLGVGTRSVSVAEAIEVWDKFTGPIVYSACSRTRCPRTREELGWAPKHLDILEDALNEAYVSEGARTAPAWAKVSAA